ncbi:CapA family protein, partial [Paenibacillus sepulcri]|nr:CapA family protein [Paenibacillus sepulcri]
NNETEAYAPVYLEAGGISVAYIGLTRVVPEASWKATSDHAGLAETYDSTRGVKAIQEAKKHADLVVVMVHWGIERSDNPNADQKLLAHTYIDAGADLVIGSHPHVLQGFETYKGKWISYSLGNYIFNMTATDKTKDTGVLNAFCTGSGDCTLKFNPMRGVASQPTPLEGEEAQALLKRLSGISLNASINSEGYVSAK